jgi:hypothetical protein
MLAVLYHIDMSLFRRAFTTRRYDDGAWWRFIQKGVVRTKLDIYVYF